MDKDSSHRDWTLHLLQQMHNSKNSWTKLWQQNNPWAHTVIRNQQKYLACSLTVTTDKQQAQTSSTAWLFLNPSNKLMPEAKCPTAKSSAPNIQACWTSTTRTNQASTHRSQQFRAFNSRRCHQDRLFPHRIRTCPEECSGIQVYQPSTKARIKHYQSQVMETDGRTQQSKVDPTLHNKRIQRIKITWLIGIFIAHSKINLKNECFLKKYIGFIKIEKIICG